MTTSQDSHGAQPAASPFFDEETQRRMAADDSSAWRSVTGLLIAIVSFGLVIALFAVTIAKYGPSG